MYPLMVTLFLPHTLMMGMIRERLDFVGSRVSWEALEVDSTCFPKTYQTRILSKMIRTLLMYIQPFIESENGDEIISCLQLAEGS